MAKKQKFLSLFLLSFGFLVIGAGKANADVGNLINCQFAVYTSDPSTNSPDAVVLKNLGFFVRDNFGSYYQAGTPGNAVPIHLLLGNPTSNSEKNWHCINPDPTIPNLTAEIRTMYTDQLDSVVKKLNDAEIALSQTMARLLASQLRAIEEDVAAVQQTLVGLRDSNCPSGDEACLKGQQVQKTIQQIEKIELLSSEICTLKKIFEVPTQDCE